MIASQTLVRRAFFAIVAELLFARHARAVVGIRTVFAIRAGIAPARLRARFAVRCSADANRCRVKRTAQFASAFAVRDIARRTSRARLAFVARHTFGIRFTRVFAIFTVRTIAVFGAGGFYALAFFIDQIPVGAGALRIFRANDAFRVRHAGVFALLARAAIRIAETGNRGTAAFAVGNLTRGTRVFAIIVVACRARFAFAG